MNTTNKVLAGGIAITLFACTISGCSDTPEEKKAFNEQMIQRNLSDDRNITGIAPANSFPITVAGKQYMLHKFTVISSMDWPSNRSNTIYIMTDNVGNPVNGSIPQQHDCGKNCTERVTTIVDVKPSTDKQ